jgi:3,4-dihydroxy 2-butanone 4-phosphate synthase / GTP cyclohydrolase II
MEPMLDRAIAELRRGRPVALHGRAPGSADLVARAESVDAEMINFMVRNARGLVRLALSGDRWDELRIRAIPTTPGARLRGVGTMIEARRGVTTGISASDRAQTIAAAIDPACGADDLVRPGHIVPIRAADGGVLARPGQTEAALELACLAGGTAAVLCHVLDEHGDVADRAELHRFCRRHELELVSVSEVVEASYAALPAAAAG